MKTNVSLANELRQLSDAMLKIAEQMDPHFQPQPLLRPLKETPPGLHLMGHRIRSAIINQQHGFRNGWVSENAVRALFDPMKIDDCPFDTMIRSMGFVYSYRVCTSGQERSRFPNAGDKTVIYSKTLYDTGTVYTTAAEYDAAQRTVDDPRAEL